MNALTVELELARAIARELWDRIEHGEKIDEDVVRWVRSVKEAEHADDREA